MKCYVCNTEKRKGKMNEYFGVCYDCISGCSDEDLERNRPKPEPEQPKPEPAPFVSTPDCALGGWKRADEIRKYENRPVRTPRHGFSDDE